MDRPRLSLARRFLIWYLKHPPFNPYVTVNAAADFTAAHDYLRRLDGGAEAHVTVQHLVTAALVRVYLEHPEANASVLGSRIWRHDHIGVVMPVDVAGRDDEVGVIVVDRCEALSLRELAARTGGQVRSEKSGGRPQNAMMRRFEPFAARLPDFLLGATLDAVDRAARVPPLAARLHRLFPITTVVSNVGATLALPAGAQAFGASFTPPRRFFAIGSLLGIFPLQDMVVAREGAAVVRSMLPLTYVFDHRLFDGVMAGRILGRLVEILAAPADHFGPDGGRAP